MDGLIISSAPVELSIDNDPERIIRFYPTDVTFAENFFALAAEFEKKRDEVAKKEAEITSGSGTTFEKSLACTMLTKEAFEVLRSGIDRTFGPGTAQTVFGDRDNLTMAANFFRGVTPYIRKAREAEVKRYTSATESVVME